MITGISKHNYYGYVVMEFSYPYDNEIWETETYEEAQAVVNIILRENPKRKVYVHKVTREEFEREANIRANMI